MLGTKTGRRSMWSQRKNLIHPTPSRNSIVTQLRQPQPAYHSQRSIFISTTNQLPDHHPNGETDEAKFLRPRDSPPVTAFDSLTGSFRKTQENFRSIERSPIAHKAANCPWRLALLPGLSMSPWFCSLQPFLSFSSISQTPKPLSNLPLQSSQVRYSLP